MAVRMCVSYGTNGVASKEIPSQAENARLTACVSVFNAKANANRISRLKGDFANKPFRVPVKTYFAA